MPRTARLLAPVVVALVTAACGGGNDNDSAAPAVGGDSESAALRDPEGREYAAEMLIDGVGKEDYDCRMTSAAEIDCLGASGGMMVAFRHRRSGVTWEWVPVVGRSTGEARAPDMIQSVFDGAGAALPDVELTDPETQASGGSSTQSNFYSPSGNIQCELDEERAYCQTDEPFRSVTTNREGRINVCSGIGCIGDGPETAFMLPYGKSVSFGSFRCTSSKNGMACLVVGSGHGFKIARSGVERW
jgi:hypothetical protein